MKGKIEDIIKKISGDTPLEIVAAYCDTIEDLELLMASVKPTEKKNIVRLPEDLVRAAVELVKNMTPDEITTSFIQRNMNIGYPQAAALCDMLKSTTRRKI